jgi:hypothetical protein
MRSPLRLQKARLQLDLETLCFSTLLADHGEQWRSIL